jgi:DNA-binding cell septation regulator SpoVG
MYNMRKDNVYVVKEVSVSNGNRVWWNPFHFSRTPEQDFHEICPHICDKYMLYNLNAPMISEYIQGNVGGNYNSWLNSQRGWTHRNNTMDIGFQAEAKPGIPIVYHSS